MASALRSLDHTHGYGTRVQWSAHDKPGGQAAQRRLRQRAALEAKARKRMCGVAVDEQGRTPAGILVPWYVPRRERPRR